MPSSTTPFDTCAFDGTGLTPWRGRNTLTVRHPRLNSRGARHGLPTNRPGSPELPMPWNPLGVQHRPRHRGLWHTTSRRALTLMTNPLRYRGPEFRSVMLAALVSERGEASGSPPLAPLRRPKFSVELHNRTVPFGDLPATVFQRDEFLPSKYPSKPMTAAQTNSLHAFLDDTLCRASDDRQRSILRTHRLRQTMGFLLDEVSRRLPNPLHGYARWVIVLGGHDGFGRGTRTGPSD